MVVKRHDFNNNLHKKFIKLYYKNFKKNERYKKNNF